MKPLLRAAAIGMMIMGAKVFVDTNVLLRAMLTNMELHTEADRLLKRMLSENAELWISGQVIREFIVQATHPKTLKIPLTVDQIVREVHSIEQLFQVADETIAVRVKLLELLQVFPTRGKQIHDANIVATMLVHEIDKLLTFNTEDFNRYASKIELISP